MQTDLGLIPDRSHVDPTSTNKRPKIVPKSYKTIDSIAYSMDYSMDSMESMDSMDSMESMESMESRESMESMEAMESMESMDSMDSIAPI